MSYCSLAECHEGSLFGGKAVQLGEALRGGLPVPPGIALSVDFVEGLVAGDAAAVVAVANALVELGPPVAARSSARGEDSAEASFAGQHVTLLNL
ncbi:MAG: hypothetical protein KC609_14970, partial [Myxococcales bacterium]|nr:hypothetical protein [Myxococcales bacterium]